MSNIIQISKTRRVKVVAHRITVELMPEEVKSRLIHAAIRLNFLWGDCVIELPDNVDIHVEEAFRELNAAASLAGQYTVQIETEIDEPI